MKSITVSAAFPRFISSDDKGADVNVKVDRAKLSDAQLVCLYKTGDSVAASVLYARYHDVAQRVAFREVKDVDRAEDAVQDVFISVLAKVKSGQYKETGIFKSYLLKSVKNKAKDFSRAANRQAVPVDFSDPVNIPLAKFDDGESLQKAIEKESLLTFVEHNAQTLPDNLREVFNLRMQGVGFKEIATRLSISINTATSRAMYARQRLLKMYNAVSL